MLHSLGTKSNDKYKGVKNKPILEVTLSVLLPEGAQGSFIVSVHNTGIMHTSMTQVCMVAKSPGAAVRIVIPIQVHISAFGLKKIGFSELIFMGSDWIGKGRSL